MIGLLKRIFKTERPWQPMSTAPRDGTEIEIKCTYGYEPWIQRARWKMYDDLRGKVWEFNRGTFVDDKDSGPRFHGANNSNLQWRYPQST